MQNDISGTRILPFYVLCEESESMSTNGGIDAMNSFLPELHGTFASDPTLSQISIGVLAFSDVVEELMPLSNLCDIRALTGLKARNLANFGEAFRQLRTIITRDVEYLRTRGATVYRPIVLFITDGDSTDEWESDHHLLTDRKINPFAPHIIAFGAAEAQPETIMKIGTAGNVTANLEFDLAGYVKELVRTLY